MRWAVFILLVLVILGGCSKKNVVPRYVGDHEIVEINGVKLLEGNRDEDDQVIVGFISDIHGETRKAQLLADTFVQQGVEYIFILGDSSLNEELHGVPDEMDDKEELIAVWTIFAKTELPVFVMPGNHEGKEDYTQAYTEIRAEYNNVFDMTRNRILDLDDIALLVIPGYHDSAFLPEDGYLYTPADYAFIPDVSKALATDPILLTHGPPLTNGSGGIDFVKDAGNVGDGALVQLLREAEIKYSISGHIHESGPRIVGKESQPLEFDTPLYQAWMNIGAGENGNAVIVRMFDGVLRARNLQVN